MSAEYDLINDPRSPVNEPDEQTCPFCGEEYDGEYCDSCKYDALYPTDYEKI